MFVSSLSGAQHYDIRIDRRECEQGGAGYYDNNVYIWSLSGSQHYDIRIDRRDGEQGGAGYCCDQERRRWVINDREGVL